MNVAKLSAETATEHVNVSLDSLPRTKKDQ